jgi:hypothetical protein
LDKDAVAKIQVKDINFDELRCENLDKDAVEIYVKSVDFDALHRENLDKDAVVEVYAAVDFDRSHNTLLPLNVICVEGAFIQAWRVELRRVNHLHAP